MTRQRLVWLAIALCTTAGFVRAAPPNAVMLSIPCGSCHGTLGISADPAMPSLAGQSPDYFTASMRRFKNDERPSTIMGRLAKGYADADFAAMASFYARLKPAVAGDGRMEPALAERGRAVFYKHCRNCHLDRGVLWRQIHQGREHDPQCRRCHAEYGSDAGAPTPLIAGQRPSYLRLQLEDFRSGVRRMSRTKAERLKNLSPEDLEAVAAFYANQIPE